MALGGNQFSDYSGLQIVLVHWFLIVYFLIICVTSLWFLVTSLRCYFYFVVFTYSNQISCLNFSIEIKF